MPYIIKRTRDNGNDSDLYLGFNIFNAFCSRGVVATDIANVCTPPNRGHNIIEQSPLCSAVIRYENNIITRPKCLF